MGLFSAVVDRVTRAVQRVTQTAAERAAPRIEEKLRADATTRRGNVPQFGPGPKGHPMSYVAISATANGSTVDVKAAGWVMEKAAEKGQVEEWAAIVREEARRSLK